MPLERTFICKMDLYINKSVDGTGTTYTVRNVF